MWVGEDVERRVDGCLRVVGWRVRRVGESGESRESRLERRNVVSSLENFGTMSDGQMQNALDYVGKVKKTFAGRRDIYNDFLTTLKEYQERNIDAPAVAHRIRVLFAGHPDLIQGFSTFLPPGVQVSDVPATNQTPNPQPQDPQSPQPDPLE